MEISTILSHERLWGFFRSRKFTNLRANVERAIKQFASLFAQEKTDSKEPSIHVIEDRRIRGSRDLRLQEHLFHESTKNLRRREISNSTSHFPICFSHRFLVNFDSDPFASWIVSTMFDESKKAATRLRLLITNIVYERSMAIYELIHMFAVLSIRSSRSPSVPDVDNRPCTAFTRLSCCVESNRFI